jgi:gamma-glutamyltranspeptidase/glutathione hydrolase
VSWFLAGAEDHGIDGEAARRVARDMRAGGGLLTASDWSAYRVVEREPLRARYRGRELLANPPPSLGGSLVVLALRLLGRCDPISAGFGSQGHLCALLAVMQEVDRLREQRLGGDAGGRDLEASAARVRVASGGTTHVSVVDAEGNAASMSTSNGEGSGYVVPGSGIMLNNMMGEDDLHPEGFHASAPGLRVASMMSPSILCRDGELELALGSGGSKRIRSALVQVIVDLLDFGMGVRDAVEAPRIHWDGACAQVEPGFEPAVLDAVARRWAVNPWPVRDVYFGGVHAVGAVGNGEGAGDSRRAGHAAAA